MGLRPIQKNTDMLNTLDQQGSYQQEMRAVMNPVPHTSEDPICGVFTYSETSDVRNLGAQGEIEIAFVEGGGADPVRTCRGVNEAVGPITKHTP